MSVGRRRELDRVREEYLEWLLLDQRTRRVHGLPQSHAEFAEVKGTTDRTLRRWRNEDEGFQQRLEQRRVEVAQRGPNGAVVPSPRSYPQTDPRAAGRFEPPEPVSAGDDPAVVGVEDPDERIYRVVKDEISRGAREGDDKLFALYMKWWGNEFVEREREARESAFLDLSDDELVGQVLDLVGEERVRGWLAGR